MADSTGRFFEGLVVGGILGFLFGLLSAPKSGAELRRQLADGSEDLYKQASDSLVDLNKSAGQALTDAKSRGGEVLKKARDSVQVTKDQLTTKFSEMAGQGANVLVDDPESMTSG
jgi:gas vesicle protein